MLKIRLIPCIILKGDLIVQSYFFKRYLPIGNVSSAIEFFVNWDVDEIIILDIEASKEKRPPQLEIIREAAQKCFVPLTIGGGIRSIETINDVLRSGADKICINSYAVEKPEFIRESAEIFGSQCITVSMDVKKVNNNDYEVFINNGRKSTGLSPVDWAKKIEKYNAGEILLNSIDRDGSRKGYDLELLIIVSSIVNIPVIACGGVGKVEHLADGIIKGRCQAVAAANIFQHTEHSTIAAKSHLNKSGVDVRLSSLVQYDDFIFDHLGRPL